MARTLHAAAEHLVSLVASCQNLVGELGQTVAATERSAGDVAYGAVQQEKRLADMRSALGPMTSALEQASSQLGELRAITVNMALGLGMVDHAMSVFSSTLRSAESSAARPGAAADSPLLRVHSEQHEALRRVRDQFAELRRRLDEIVDVQSRGQHQGQSVHRATTELGRVAKLHAEGAASLAGSAERLRQEAVALNDLLSQLETAADPDDPG
jgi:chromosome segregation ATPase